MESEYGWRHAVLREVPFLFSISSVDTTSTTGNKLINEVNEDYNIILRKLFTTYCEKLKVHSLSYKYVRMVRLFKRK